MHNKNVLFDDIFSLKPHPTSIHITLKRFLIRMLLHVHFEVTGGEESTQADVAHKVLLIILFQHVQIVETFVAESLATSWALITLLRVHEDNVRTKEVHFAKIFIAVRTGLS